MNDREREVIATGFESVAEDLESLRRILGRIGVRLRLAAEAVRWVDPAAGDPGPPPARGGNGHALEGDGEE